ncbi:Baseplate assembly protein GpJ [Escherichia coli]|nr:Baseplate assembly protein GpJ [Escherichia coli]
MRGQLQLMNFHARSADGRVADASATSPAPAEVVLTVLSREGDGTAEKDLLDVVEKALNSENVRPVADRLTVRSAEIIPYRVEATFFSIRAGSRAGNGSGKSQPAEIHRHQTRLVGIFAVAPSLPPAC